MKKIITTQRLFLREFNEKDDAFLFELMNSAGWIQNIGDRNIKTFEDAQAYLKKNYIAVYPTQGFGFYVMEKKETGETIGMCGLIKRPELEHIDIGFALLPGFEKKGYAFEAASATLKYATEVLNMQKILAITIFTNKNSQRLLEKIGLRFEKMITYKEENVMLFSTT